MTSPSKTTPTIISPAVCVGNNLRKISRAVTQAYDEALRPSGVTVAQFSTLGTLHESGPLSINQLAAAMDLDRTTLARNVKIMARDELVEIKPSAQDKRVKEIHLTRNGQLALETAAPLWLQVQTRFVNGLGQDQLAMLMGGFTTLHTLAKEG